MEGGKDGEERTGEEKLMAAHWRDERARQGQGAVHAQTSIHPCGLGGNFKG